MDKRFKMSHILLLSITPFFNVFSNILIEGDPKSALTEPHSIVLSEKLANKYFGNENPLGKTLKLLPDGGSMWDGNTDMTVTGVFKNLPENSHLVFDLLIPADNINFIQYPSYTSFTAYTYLLLKEETNATTLSEKFPDVVARFALGEIQRKDPQATADDLTYTCFLQPIRDIHLKSDLKGEMRAPGSMRKVKLFAAIAILILMIAVINYMNLATAKSAERVKEVGIRKTLGSGRWQIGGRFLLEALVISGLSFLLCLAWLYLGLPVFGEYSGTEFSIVQILHWKLIPLYLGFVLLLGFLSGSYPALSLSSFSPSQILKGKWLTRPKGQRLRNGLILFQFAISVFLFIGTIVIYKQVEFIQSKDLGFDKEQIVILKGTRFFGKGTDRSFKESIE